MDKELIEILNKYCTVSDKNMIIIYLVCKENFYKLLKIDNTSFNEQLINELIILGKILNYFRDQLELNNKTKDLNEYFYSLGILSILNMNYIPNNFHEFISKQDYTKINSFSIEEVFKSLYKRYILIYNIYIENGDFGLTKYIMINRDLSKIKNKTLFDLVDNKVLSYEEIIYLTSSQSNFNNGKCYRTAKKILKTKILEKKSEFSNKHSNTIYL